MKLEFKETNILYQSAFGLYRELTDNGAVPALLMESRTVNLAYGKQSIVAANPALKFTARNEMFTIQALTEQGRNLLAEFSDQDFPFAHLIPLDDGIYGTFSREFNPNLAEEQRINKISAGSVLKSFLQKFSADNNYAGLYGAVAYDFARNFEDFGHNHDSKPGEDFVLFLPGDIYVIDEIRQQATHYQIQIDGNKTPFESHPLTLHDVSSTLRIESMSEEEYIAKAASLISDIKNGRFMQCVLSRSISVPLIENPIDAYARLRDINPSPYCFYFDLDGEILYGSSPEIHAVVQDGDMIIRPLAGTKRRSQNALEDALLRIELQTDPKERSEHSMLVDLARSEVYRLCEPESVRVTDMFTVEQYPNLYHLATGVRGRLKEGMDSVDVLLTTIPAGTLSGAPKLEAMKAIEDLEPTRRGFYGGAVGYLTFNGETNTGITIRSVHVKNGFSTVQAGAGIVAGSDPVDEAKEVMLKLERPLQNLEAIVR